MNCGLEYMKNKTSSMLVNYICRVGQCSSQVLPFCYLIFVHDSNMLLIPHSIPFHSISVFYSKHNVTNS